MNEVQIGDDITFTYGFYKTEVTIRVNYRCTSEYLPTCFSGDSVVTDDDEDGGENKWIN